MESKLPPFLPWEKIRETLAQAVEQSFNAVFSSLGGLELEVDRALDRDIEDSRRRLATSIVAASAKQAAAVGAATSSVDAFPLSWPALLPSILSEFSLCLRIHLSLLLKLSTLYGPDRPRGIRKREAMGILVTYGSDPEVGGLSYVRLSKDMVRVGGCNLSRHALVKLARRLLDRFVQKRLIGIVPIAGAAASGGFNYLWTKRLGEFAIEYLERSRSEALNCTLGSEGEDARFVRCLMLALVNAAKCNRLVSPAQKTLLNESMMLFGIDRDEREDILRASRDLERIPRLPAQDVEKLAQEERQEIYERANGMLVAGGVVSSNRNQYLEILRRQLNPEPTVARQPDQSGPPSSADGRPGE